MLLLGVLQAQAAGVVAGSYDLLETQVLASNQASVTFSSLSTYAADYQHLQLRYVARNTQAVNNQAVFVRLNGVSSAGNYKSHLLEGNGSSVVSGAYGESAEMVIGFITPGANATADAYGAGIIDVLDFGSSAKNTTIRAFGGRANAGGNAINLNSGVYLNTAAITSFSIIAKEQNFTANSRFSLYGIRKS